MSTRSRRAAADFPSEVLTLKQFLRLPEIKPALEFIRGRIIQKVSPTLPQAIITLELANRIDRHARPGRLGLVLPKLRCNYGGESLVAAISCFAAGRLPRDEKGHYVERVFLPPDLAIEILSPGPTVKFLTAKLARCLQNGVRLAWLIQPRKQREFVFRPGQTPRELGPGDVLDGHEVLPGFTLPLAELFGWLVAGD
jgi:Uma2 family endonuclease